MTKIRNEVEIQCRNMGYYWELHQSIQKWMSQYAKILAVFFSILASIKSEVLLLSKSQLLNYVVTDRS